MVGCEGGRLPYLTEGEAQVDRLKRMLVDVKTNKCVCVCA